MKVLALVLASGCTLYWGDHDTTDGGSDSGCPSYGCNTCGLMPTASQGCTPGDSCQYEDWEHGCQCTCTAAGHWSCYNETVGSMCPTGGGGEWTTPTPLPFDTAADESAPALSADGQHMIFVRAGDLWQTHLTSGGAWSAPQKIAALSTTAVETDPSLSPAGDVVYFTRGTTVMQSRLSGTTWGAPSTVTLGSFDAVDFEGDQVRLLATSNGVDPDIWELRRANVTSAWGTPTRIDSLISPAIDRAATTSTDGLLLIFESTRDGNHQLYESTRTSTALPWSPPTRITIAGQFDANVGDPEVTDGGLLYFTSDASGNRDLYMVERVLF